MEKKYIQTDKAPSAIGAYSQAVALGDLVFLSGQIPLIPDKMEIISSEIDEQIIQVFNNLEAVLKESGSSLTNVLKLNVYLVNLSYFPNVNQHMEKIFPKPFPARAVVEVSKLPKDALIEIDAIAKL
ncbi:MAG: Rid family detoxifying hydrolase [Pseudomonadota bacterium]|nr:Rid family detoxifying hydrolase [Pseudomonadota bacterium]|tara:strand:- start:12709 stop:13089 length:381 start_codon:yes stop_codon:yes gene_type:complete